MTASRTCRVVGQFAALALVFALGPASAQASPCHEWQFTAPSKSVLHQVTITAAGSAYKKADVLRPRKVSPNARFPGIVLLHGRGGQKCALWWAARLLAGKGFETVVLTYPSNATPVAVAEGEGAMAARSAIAWLRSNQNPFRSHLKANEIAIVGHSLGGIAAQDVQQDASLPYLKTIVALDNLRKTSTVIPAAPSGAIRRRSAGRSRRACRPSASARRPAVRPPTLR